MNKFVVRTGFLISFVLSLTACLGPKTPQEVTQAFWKAVINNDVSDAVKYSTLTDAKQYDGFSKDWAGYQATWGKVVIDGDKASIDAEFSTQANSGKQTRKFVTYLVQQDKEWKVDYDRTKMSVRGGVLGAIFDKLGQFSDDLNKQINSSADNFNHEMEQMSKKLEQMADSFSAEASKQINRYAEQLRQSIDELAESINRALKDDNNLNDHDKHVLRVAADDLHQDSQNLADPTVETVSKSTRNIGETQQQLDSINGASLDHYKQEWHDLTHKIERDMQKMLEELSALKSEGHS